VRRATTGGRIAAVAALLLAGAVALTGCVTIPTGGGVGSQKISADQGADNTTIRAANPPRKGAGAGEIVAGFVRAGGSPQGSYNVAKQYLTTGYGTKWKPSAATVISDSTVAPFADDDGTGTQSDYTVGLTVTGQIDATGVLTSQAPTERPLRYHLVKQGGEWRIDQAPDLTVLRTRDLGIVARDYELYFFDPSYEYLVPDRRWFVDQGGTYVQGRIVGALLAGPSPYLASPVTVSAFPAGAQPGDTPAIEGGTVTVDLSSNVLDAGPTQQSRMLAQLTASLRSTTVTAVTMTANGVGVPATEPASAETNPAAFYEAVGSDGKLFGAVSGSTVAPLALGNAIQSLSPTAVSFGGDRTSAAVLGAGGVSLVTSSARPVVDPRAGLLAPTLDRNGWVWSTTADPGSLIVVRGDGRPRSIPLPTSGQVASIAISRDGTRLLVALAADAGARLLVFGVQRDKDGAPVGLGTPLELPVDAGRPIIDAAWVDSDSVATIAGSPGAIDDVREYPLGAQQIDHGGVRDGRRLAAGTGSDFTSAMRVLLGSGELDQPSSIGDWQSTGVKLALLAVQQ
jgi:hypothetical protein